MTSEGPLLNVSGIGCKKRGRILLDQVSFTLQAAETLGILGLRGSGKSLLLYILAGAVRATEGSVTLGGFTPRQNAKYCRQLGLVTGVPSLFADLRVAENLDLIGSRKGAAKTVETAALAERLALNDHAAETAGALSPGVYQRLALACALLNQPRLLLLDDVLYGLDAESARLIRQELHRFQESGGAILRVLHGPEDLAEVEQAAWMEKGRFTRLSPAEAAARWPSAATEAGDPK